MCIYYTTQAVRGPITKKPSAKIYSNNDLARIIMKLEHRKSLRFWALAGF